MSLYERFYCSTCFERYYIHPQEFQPALGYHPTPAEPHQYTSTHRNRSAHLHTITSSWGWK